jgi:hypothetical protein
LYFERLFSDVCGDSDLAFFLPHTRTSFTHFQEGLSEVQAQ